MKGGLIEGAFSVLIVAWPHFSQLRSPRRLAINCSIIRACDFMEYEQASSDRLFALNLWQALASHLGCCELHLGEEWPTQTPENMHGPL